MKLAGKASCLALVLCGITLSAALTVPEFYARRDYPSAGGFVVLGDVTGDGIQDIVSVALAYSISTLRGNSYGSFGAAVMTAVEWQFLSGAALLDVNGDGKMDLIIGGSPEGNGGIGVLFSNGDGTFQQPVFYSVDDGTLGNVVVGDFNGDGIPDVIAAGGKGLWLFSGTGVGTFNPGALTPINQSQASWLAAADFNGDGKLDLAISFYPKGLYTAFGNGDGTFQPLVLIGNNASAHVTAGAVTRDGHTDIVIPGAAIYFNNGEGGFLGPVQIALTGNSVAVGDVNGDGLPDLVSSQGCVAYGLGATKFAPQVCYQVANTQGWYSVALGEFTKSGAAYTDIVTGLNGSVSVLLNLGRGLFMDGLWTSVPGSGACAAAGDFYDDGTSDLAVPTTSGIVVLHGTGKAATPYATGTTIPLSSPGCPIAVDVNGDGILDLLEGANSLGGVGVFLGKGDGTFGLASVIPFATAANMVVGDFNHDGNLDVATSSNQVALGKGDGTFQAPSAILSDLPEEGFTWIAAGDVNKDGWTDLLATQPFDGTGALYVMLNNKQGGFSLTTITENAGPDAVTLADVNGDGNLDAIVMEEFSYSAHVYLGNGNGGFKSIQDGIPYPFVDPLPAQVADVNGDGILDLLLAANGSIGIALGKGNGTFYPPFAIGAGPNLGQVFAQNLHGQAAMSNLPDLVAPDSSGGVTVLINITQ